MMTFKEYYANKQKTVDKELKTILDTRKIPLLLREAMTYSLNAGGKRMRPVLCLMVDDVLRGKFEEEHHPDIYRLALSLECIHTYSLIHDDLPSMDDDHLRRGKPTCHIKYDEATAILAGDTLLTFAFELFGEFQAVSKVKTLQKLISTLSISAGGEGMTGGQMLDILADKKNSQNTKTIDMQVLREIHGLKTGALIRASVLLPTYYHEFHDSHLKSYSEHIGIAFQITDDILDVTSSSEILGKPAKSDIENEKLTYVSALGLKESRKQARETTEIAVSHLSKIEKETHYLKELAYYIIDRIN